MTTEYKQLPHTAITTWSGYIYQGKVALYHVLHLLCTHGDCSTFCLQLDSLDDFAILVDNKPRSLHQVKANKSTYFSNYEEAVNQLKQKTISQQCTEGYLHVARTIQDKTPEEIKVNYSPIQLYHYNTKPSCSLGDIDNRIKSLIQQYNEIYFADMTWRTDESHLEKLRCHLEQIIVRKMISIHSKVHQDLVSDRLGALQETIPFSNFIDILKADQNSLEENSDYFLYRIKGDLGKYYEYFHSNNDIEDEETCLKLSQYMAQINSLNDEMLCGFIKNIIPHREFKFSSLAEYKDNTILQDEIEGGFLKVLTELKSASFNASEHYFHWSKNNTCYAPTSIIDGDGSKDRICKKIVNNALSTDLRIMYEVDKLITIDIQAESILDSHILEAENQVREKITDWKNVSLITLEQAKGEIS